MLAAPAAKAQTEQQDLVEKARITVDDLRKDKEFGNARDLMHRARAVLIVPSLVKGGFFVGGEGGDGLLLTRDAQGWSDPSFYTIGSASFGLQIGLEQSELVLFIMSDKALHSFTADEFKIGAQAGLAIVTLGSEAEAATTGNLNADIIAWSSATGAYAGLTLNGSVVKPRESYDAAYYGHAVRPSEIVYHHEAHNPGDSGLRRALDSLS